MEVLATAMAQDHRPYRRTHLTQVRAAGMDQDHRPYRRIHLMEVLATSKMVVGLPFLKAKKVGPWVKMASILCRQSQGLPGLRATDRQGTTLRVTNRRGRCLEQGTWLRKADRKGTTLRVTNRQGRCLVEEQEKRLRVQVPPRPQLRVQVPPRPQLRVQVPPQPRLRLPHPPVLSLRLSLGLLRPRGQQINLLRIPAT